MLIRVPYTVPHTHHRAAGGRAATSNFCLAGGRSGRVLTRARPAVPVVLAPPTSSTASYLDISYAVTFITSRRSW